MLRTSLMLSLGLAPLACGGTAVTISDGSGGGAAQAGAPGSGGAIDGGGGSPGSGGAIDGRGGAIDGRGGAIDGIGGAFPTGECPKPVMNSISKLIDCANGRSHRAQALACTYSVAPPGDAGAGGEAGATRELKPCLSNADCASLPRGYCETSIFQDAVCRSGCVTDSDCERGICACDGDSPGRCVDSGCRTDADCGANALCAPVGGVCGGTSFQCTTAQDECITSDDCRGKGGGACSMEDGHRICSGAICGRPFLIAEAPRMAAIETRADWLDATLSPDTSGLSPLERAELAAHWARLGQMEHASIAAFARFNLQLLSLGAPSELVEACNRALADETAHARACFALASAYGDAALGPARLDIEHCFEDISLLAIAKLVLREGCLGETVASLEALAAAEAASDPAVKRALTRIANDELRHAELAFKFLRWALTLTSVEEHHELASVAERQLADFESDAQRGQRGQRGQRAPSDSRLVAHGLIADQALRAIRLAAVREVSRPLLAALFDSETSSAAYSQRALPH